MKPYRTIAIIIYAAALTSAWWAVAIFGAISKTQIPFILFATLLTFGALVALFINAVNEQ